jgi:hypothetical protein
MSETGFIACAHFEETIRHYGEGGTPDDAISNFIEDGDFNEYGYCRDIAIGTPVQVKVFKAIYIDSPEANVEDFEPGWGWMLGEEVDSRLVTFPAESPVKNG